MRLLIEQQIREMGLAKVQLCMWINWRKEEESSFRFNAEELKELGLDDYPEFYIIIVDKPFNSKMTEIFQGSNIEEILEQMFGYIKTGIKNPILPKSGLTIYSFMHLDISSHELQLTRGSSYITLSKWFASKKAVPNPRNEEDEECFKWAVIAALHHEYIQKDPQRISKLEP